MDLYTLLLIVTISNPSAVAAYIETITYALPHEVCLSAKATLDREYMIKHESHLEAHVESGEWPVETKHAGAFVKREAICIHEGK